MTSAIDTAFTVRTPAWWDSDRSHVRDRAPSTTAEALAWAGLTWEPELGPSWNVVTDVDLDGITRINADSLHALDAHLERDQGVLTVRRSDTRAALGSVRDGYRLVTHRKMGETMEAMLETPDVVYETGGSILGGRKVWLLARVDVPYEVPGYDTPVYPYCALLNSHDGTGAFRAIRTSVCVVCWNTWQAAEGEAEKTGYEFTFRHTANIDEHIADARRAVLGTRKRTERWVRRAGQLVRIPMDDIQQETFIAEFTVPGGDLSKLTDRSRRRAERDMQTLREIIAGPTVSGVGVGGTVFGAVQAAGEWLDHYRRYRSRDSYITRTILREEPLKRAAERLALDVVGVDHRTLERL